MINPNFVIIFLLTAIICGCENSTASNQTVNDTVTVIQDKKLSSLHSEILRSMQSYMQSTKVSYTSEHIRLVGVILTEHYRKLENIRNKKQALMLVKDTVTKLNKLNEKSQGGLIETDQREMIAEFIIVAGAKHNLNEPNEDVTEAYRDW